MPVGTSFENSAMKTCFSLSSLPASDLTPEKSVVKQRLCNSLTKNRIKATAVRRSWGSTASEHRDDFWKALQANYNYIMDNQLIDKCQESNSDLSVDTEQWSLKELNAQFSELYSWLNSVQEIIYGNEESIGDRALRAYCTDMVQEKSSLFALFNEQAGHLAQKHPQVQESVGWKVKQLNSKWDCILSILGPSECGHCEQDSCLDIDHEIKCLRIWFKNLESCLEPLNFRTKYTKTEIEAKALELEVLHRDIENHGKIVGSVVKLCKRSDASCNTVNVRRIANGLERRWHLLYLRSLEWQCHLETLSKKENYRNTCSSSDEEPANKYPRLSNKDSSSDNINYFNNSPSLENDCESMKFEDVMNTNALQTLASTSDDIDGHFREDSSQFTRSNKRAPNLATYYFRHEDTDSDMDKIEQLAKCEETTTSNMEDTSEEEWTYTKTDQMDTNDVSKATIRELVLKAEELVSPDKLARKEHTRASVKVKQWLSMDKPDDSCDASGEDDERESQFSEEFDESTITQYNSQSLSVSELQYAESTPKVLLRHKKFNGKRPNSVSCISQLGQIAQPQDFTFSTSEGALHRLALTSKNLERLNAVSANNVGLNGNNSTSSTVEENGLAPEKSPGRRRKLKSKKKSVTRLDYFVVSPKSRFLIKSGSFSGCDVTHTNERQTSSDPPAAHFGKYETSTTSGADSDEESKRLPYFKVGLKSNYLNLNRDSSPGKVEDQVAWDSYQEKYNSEAYSESHDSDAARKLLEFGEDYRNFLDSQSDWSISPKTRRRTLIYSESDSDSESLRQLLKKSRDELTCVKNYYRDSAAVAAAAGAGNEIDEMLTICDRHLDCLNKVEKSKDDLQMSRGDRELVAELFMDWTCLQRNVLKMQEHRKLQKEIIELKNLLTSFEIAENECGSVDDLSKEVDCYEKKSEDFFEYKKKLLALNVAVHRFVTENKDYHHSTLKTDIAELYRLWDSSFTRVTERLDQLRPLLQQWKTLDNRLEQLQVDLRSDEKTLHLLDTALQGGTLSDQTATYVRDVAKLLSETTSVQGCKIPELFTEGGSLSDSGISDEGSEHEIGERERRLAAIRRLVRQLEVVLAPDCKARLKMAERLNAAEEELKQLQKRCRSLIACTAAFSAPIRPSDVELKEDAEVGGSPDDEDDPGEPNTSSWFKRVMRASVPFQVVLITLLCVACLLEPQCCDNMNNFAMSLSPQLRYIKGPPPI